MHSADDATLYLLESFHRLARLAMAIERLRTAQTVGLDLKLTHLTTNDDDQFLSLVHELVTADAYLRSGSQLEFVEERTSRTPDLVVDSEVEVECKRKVADSANDKDRYDKYEMLGRKLRVVMDGSQGHTGLALVAAFSVRPTRGQIDEIIIAARRLSAGSSGREQVTRDGGCNFTLASVNLDGPGLSIPISDPNEFDLTTAEGVMRTGENGALHVGSVLTMALSCSVVQDRVRTIEKTLRSAAGQFSGIRPSIIQIDMSATAYAYNDSVAAPMHAAIDKFLRNNTRVSAIRFDQDVVFRPEEKLVLSRRSDEVLNPHAAHPLPPEHSLSGLIRG